MHHSQYPSSFLKTTSLLLGVIAVSSAAIFIRLAQAEGAPSVVIAFARLSISSLILVPIALMRYRLEISSMRGRDWLLAIISGTFLAFHFAAWITSLEFTSVASSVVLVTTTPLWVALFAPFVVNEKLSLHAALGLVLALLGGAIIGLSDSCSLQAARLECSRNLISTQGTAILGDLLALFGAWMAAGYMLAGRKLRVKLDLVPYISIVYTTASIVLLIFMLALKLSFRGLPPVAYLWFLLLGLIPQLLGHSIFNWALKFIPASLVSVVLLGEPVGSTILAFIIFSESPGWIRIAGGILILLGISIVSMVRTTRS